MPLYLKLLSLFFTAIFVVIFLFLAKKRTIKPFYSTLWLLVSVFMLCVIVFEKLFKDMATFIGLSDASFLIVITLLSFLLGYVLYLSIKLSELSDRVQEIISFTSILEHKTRNDKDEKL
jgi:hypothetical protein